MNDTSSIPYVCSLRKFISGVFLTTGLAVNRSTAGLSFDWWTLDPWTSHKGSYAYHRDLSGEILRDRVYYFNSMCYDRLDALKSVANTVTVANDGNLLIGFCRCQVLAQIHPVTNKWMNYYSLSVDQSVEAYGMTFNREQTRLVWSMVDKVGYYWIVWATYPYKQVLDKISVGGTSLWQTT